MDTGSACEATYTPDGKANRPNCFDPFEALDDILQRLGEVVAIHISGGCRDTDEIGNQVNALRAYITGMVGTYYSHTHQIVERTDECVTSRGIRLEVVMNE